MTAPYQVFVDGARDRSPQAIDKLATAIGARYGLSPTDLVARLTRGRFKVKAGVDRDTAEQYARDLERLGAVCTIVGADGKTLDLAPAGAPVAAAGVARPQTASRATPRSGAASLPPRTTEPPRSTSPLGRATPPAGVPYGPGTGRAPSGPIGALGPSPLAAAKPAAAADLGALGALGRDDGAIALSSLDGNDAPLVEPTSLAAASFTPPAGVATAAAAAIKPRAPEAPAKPSQAVRDFAGPVDMFSAPAAEDDNAELDLAVDLAAERAKKAASIAPPIAVAGAAEGPAMSSALALPASGPNAIVAPAPPLPRTSPLRTWLRSTRNRFAAGVFASILAGALPAHLIGVVRERAAFREIESQLRDRYAAAETPEQYAELPTVRARALDRKYDERGDIAVTTIALWAVLAGALAYVWFRRVPWPKLLAGG
jgi:hypothetical protein